MNEKFTPPVCETVVFDNEDVIKTSDGIVVPGEDINLPGV